MVLNTLTVGAAVSPSAFRTFLDHYIHLKSRKGLPTHHLSYHEGLNLVRKFLVYASHHTVEELQTFTSQWVPHPPYVMMEDIQIQQQYIEAAEHCLREHLKNFGGFAQVGGSKWWTWRRPGSENLRMEKIEMKADHRERQNDPDKRIPKRIMLYVHGGAYYFGSTDEHRYQMQRHARKLKAIVFAPKYRLSPQFPFPCGIADCLAAYYMLLAEFPSTSIILAGDSAGGGMVLSMLVIMRDRGIDLPAGAILISPWVDLTHSFPSVAEDNPLDYIPAHGFHHRPSSAWPPPNSDDIRALEKNQADNSTKEDETKSAQGFHVNPHPPAGTHNSTAGPSSDNNPGPQANTVPGSDDDLSVMVDGELVVIKDQIQMYATNKLLSHPLVSPVLQPSLGGLPPLFILTGGGEMLRDEQIYVAHKAADPTKYPPGAAFLDTELPHARPPRDDLYAWKPTDVYLQVWDDLCHVGPTLSFTRPAKYMYRSIAQFGAWALAKAQETKVEILDDDKISIISSSNPDEDIKEGDSSEPIGQIGTAGDPIPDFVNHMIRHRVDRKGRIFHLAPASELPACQLSPDEIGIVKPGPVRKWMEAKATWDAKYAKEKRKVQVQREKEMAKINEKSKYWAQLYGDDVPPPSALIGRQLAGVEISEETPPKKSWGLQMWSGWGSKHDELTLERRAEAEKKGQTIQTTEATPEHGAGARDLHAKEGDGEGETTGEMSNPSAAGQQPWLPRSGYFSSAPGNATGFLQPNSLASGNSSRRASSGASPLSFDPNQPEVLNNGMLNTGPPGNHLSPAPSGTSTQYPSVFEATDSEVSEGEGNTNIHRGGNSNIQGGNSNIQGGSSNIQGGSSNIQGGGSNIPDILVKSPTIERDNKEGVVRFNDNGEERRRPTAQGIAFPFSMRMGGEGIDGVMKDGVRARNMRNGKVGRDANASTESLMSVGSEVPEGFTREFDNELNEYVLVKDEVGSGSGNGKGKENEQLNIEDQFGLGSSPPESMGERVSEEESQGGLGTLSAVNRIMKGKGVAKDEETEMGMRMGLGGQTDANIVSPRISAVGNKLPLRSLKNEGSPYARSSQENKE